MTPTVPADPDKPQTIVSLLIERLDLPLHRTQQIVALLYGFESWKQLSEALSGPRNLPDENASLDEVQRRRDFQIAVLQKELALTKIDAIILVDHLGPTNLGPTSYALDKDLSRIFPGTPDEYVDSVKNLFGADTFKILENLRQNTPGISGPWLKALSRDFGFKLTARNEDDSQPVQKIAETQSYDGRVWPIYLSGISYNPGDTMDADARNAQALIENQETQALLIFSGIFVQGVARSRGQTRTRDAIIYGGKILRDAQWSDFLMPTEGIDELLGYRIRAINSLSENFILEHVIEDAISIASHLAARTVRLNILGDSDLELESFKTNHDWISIVMLPRTLLRVMKAMSKIPKDLS